MSDKPVKVPASYIFDEDATMTNVWFRAELTKYDEEEYEPELSLTIDQAHGGGPCYETIIKIGRVTAEDLRGLAGVFTQLAYNIDKGNI